MTRSVARLVRSRAGAAQLHMAANMDHYASSYGDKGWGCGYRNLQMVLSSRQKNFIITLIYVNRNEFVLDYC